ncbi:hypothetical protein DENSPDRAFT_841196 [Dentipellis sp. KUC8613]|nr:hypothetical protein DENSPDRAFT_841196 [Dentipellis sp. KUC8613]
MMSTYPADPTQPALEPGASHHDSPPDGSDDEHGQGKKKKTKRRKVNHACLYCRRSHMTCDEGRPCQRCIKREIGHLCHDERRPSKGEKQTTPTASNPQPPPHMALPPPNVYPSQPVPALPVNAWPSMTVPQGAYNMYQLESFGKEFSVLSDFLDTLDEQAFFNPPGAPPPQPLPPQYPAAAAASSTSASAPATATATPSLEPAISTLDAPPAQQQQQHPQSSPTLSAQDAGLADALSGGAMSKTEKFLLTAADQEPGTRDERLKRVIRSKYEAGLLKPYNYVKGYARLSRWMDRNVSQDSKQQILQPLSVLRPKFRAVAQSLRDIDLVFIEEAFERLLLDYDRVFSAMGIPACLWRRTGEIYKGNREFAELVGVDGYMLRDGRLCIYELMAEESAVNYWEKYGNVAFDSTQKAVLTSCVLRFKPLVAPASGSVTPARRAAPLPGTPNEEGFINCCFSFTIRRDTWGIPSMIVGNFIRC